MRGSVRKSTYDRNESLCRVHLIPALGRKKLKTLGAADVAGFYRSRLDSGCSAASVRKMHETLHKSLKQAVRWGYMTKNPADDVDAPRVHTEEVHPLTRDEARRFLRPSEATVWKLSTWWLCIPASGKANFWRCVGKTWTWKRNAQSTAHDHEGRREAP